MMNHHKTNVHVTAIHITEMEREGERGNEGGKRRKGEWREGRRDGGREKTEIPTMSKRKFFLKDTLLLSLDNHYPVSVFTSLFYFMLCSRVYSSPIFSAYF